MKGTELYNLITLLNGDMEIDQTLAENLVETGKTIIEEERDWMVLRKTDSSKSVTTANTWETEIDLSSIPNFSKFYGDYPIKLFDGDNKIEEYSQVPFDKRLFNKDNPNTFCFDENSKKLYLNGIVPFSGTLWIDHVVETEEIDLASDENVWTEFKGRFVRILAFYAVGIHKGAIDFDNVVKYMLPEHKATLISLKNAMMKWDDDKQSSIIAVSDPTERYGSGHYDRHVNTTD